MKHIILLILSLVILEKVVKSQYLNPCPKFKSDGRTTHAFITIPPQRGSTIQINVEVGIEGAYMGDTPKLLLAKSKEDSIQDLNSGHSIQFICRFPRIVKYAKILQIHINEKQICNGGWTTKIGFTTWLGLTLRFKSNNLIKPTSRRPQTVFSTTPSTTSTTTPSKTTTSRVNGICGEMAKMDRTIPLVISGQEIKPGQFPWIVAIYKEAFNFNNFICGGTLISDKYALTAAHCTENITVQYYLDFGRHNISNLSEEKAHTIRKSLAVINHEKYVRVPDKSLHNDIALIFFPRIEFTDQIRPICLWLQRTPVRTSFRGDVVGWGRTENGDADKTQSEVPLGVRVMTTSSDNCKSVFPNNNPDQVFCARGEMAGPCTGDSGGGLFVQYKKIWYLRGIISASLGDLYSCNVDTYSLYTDISYYIEWLRNFL